MTTYVATISWALEGDFAKRTYSRAHSWRFDGGAVVPASASPHNVPLPYAVAANVDPDEALVAAASSCHMLWFLDFAARGGYVVTRYEDRAEGTVGRDERGRMAFTQIILKPEIVFAGAAPAPDQLAALHDAAHKHCFIANSLRCAVIVQS